MISPARSRSPNRRRADRPRGARYRSTRRYWPADLLVRANSAPRRMMRQVRPSEHAGARRRRTAEHHVALIDVAGEDRLRILGRRRKSASSMAGEMPAIAVAAASRSAPAGTSRPICTAISGSATGFDQPASETLPPDSMRALCGQKADQRRGDRRRSWQRRRGRSRPSSRAACRRQRAAARRSSSCAACRARCAGPPRLSSLLVLVTIRIDFVAGRLDRAGAHPAPDQHDVLVRGVVEAVPAAARRVDHVAFARRLLAVVGVDVAAGP